MRKIQLARTEQRAQQRVESYAARLMGEYKLSPEQMADILRRAALVLVAGAARDGASER